MVQAFLAVSYKAKHTSTTQTNNCTFGHLSQKNENLCSHKNLYTAVHSPNWKQLGHLQQGNG